MIDHNEIFRTYKKYGWNLRRILAPTKSRDKFASLGLPVDDFEIEAAWFSREPEAGGVAWEIRYLGVPAFALLDNLDEADPEFAAKRRAVETRLIAAVKSRLDNS